MGNYTNQVTTLLLDSAFLPHCFLTGRSTFLHLIKDTVKCFDADSNLVDTNEWFSNEGIIFGDNQPYMTSKNRVWFLPTIVVLKNRKFFKVNKNTPTRLNLRQLCVIFDFTCQICYEVFDKEDLTIEHIYPKSKGGTKEIENITLSCKACNQNKKDIYPFKNIKNKDLKSTPLPIMVKPENQKYVRPEWDKFFIYKKT